MPGCIGSAAQFNPLPRDHPCPATHMPYLEEGHVFAIVLLALLQVRAVDEGAALLGVAIACRDVTRSARQLQPLWGSHVCTSAPTGGLPWPRAPRSCLAQGQAMAPQLLASPLVPHTGRGQESHGALPGRAGTQAHRSASTQRGEQHGSRGNPPGRTAGSNNSWHGAPAGEPARAARSAASAGAGSGWLLSVSPRRGQSRHGACSRVSRRMSDPAPRHAPEEQGPRPRRLRRATERCPAVPAARRGSARGSGATCSSAEPAELLGQGCGCLLH